MKPHAKVQLEKSRKSNILQTTARQRCVSYQQGAWSQPCPATAPSLLQSRGSKLHSIYTAQTGGMPAPHTSSISVSIQRVQNPAALLWPCLFTPALVPVATPGSVLRALITADAQHTAQSGIWVSWLRSP